MRAVLIYVFLFSFLGVENGLAVPDLLATFVRPENGLSPGKINLRRLDTLEEISFDDPLDRNSHLRAFGNRLYILSRVWNRMSLYEFRVSGEEFSYGRLSEYSLYDQGFDAVSPRDILEVNEHKAYVSLYRSPAILVVDPLAERGQAILEEINLSSFAIHGEVPEMDQMVLSEGILYVSLRRTSDSLSEDPFLEGPSMVLAIDTQTNEVIDSFALAGANPLSHLEIWGDELFLGLAGPRMGYGSLQRIDLLTGEVQTWAKSFLPQGRILQIEKKNREEGYVIWAHTLLEERRIFSFSPLIEDPVEGLGEFPAANDLLFDGKSNRLFVGGDRLHALDARTGEELSSSPFQIGGKALSLAVVKPKDHTPYEFISVGEVEIEPNPMDGYCEVRFNMGKIPGHVSVEVYNLRGRWVAEVYSGVMGTGEQVLRWDGRDDRGQSVSSSTYFLRLTTPSFHGVRKVSVVR